MQQTFYKYHGAGNDFIIMYDEYNNVFNNVPDRQRLIATLCHRRFGIGADGLMLLQNDEKYDFKMVYFNSDGKPGTMCGNGGRCLVKFAFDVGKITHSSQFVASDGPHEASILEDDGSGGIVSLGMNDVKDLEQNKDRFILDTGSPHMVQFVENVKSLNVFEEGRNIRYSSEWEKQGINVNFVEITEDELLIRTYERGVENETWACGTGVTAAAIAAHAAGIKRKNNTYTLWAKGGKLSVSFDHFRHHHYQNIVLTGPAVKVFEGELDLSRIVPVWEK
ncbi:MAG: diaminopimelate epimerase [Bacteroidota bacterium]